MQEISYPIKLYGDSSALEKTIQGVEGKLNKLSGDEFVIVLKYDGNIKGLNSQIDKIMSLHPELPIDFKYNLNKKALEAEEKKLQSIIDNEKINILSVASDDNLKKQIQDIVSFIKKNTQELDDGVLFFEDEKKINTVSKKIRDLYSNIATAKEYFGDNWKPPKEFMDFISFVVNNAYQLENVGIGQGAKIKTDLFSTKEIEKQKTKIEAVKSVIDNIEKDMTGNKSIGNTIAASNQQIAELLDKLEEIKKALESIGERIPNTLEKPLEGVLNKSEITVWKDSFISALNEIKDGFDKILGKNNKLSEIFKGYNIGDNLRTTRYKERNPERSLGISSKTGYIHGEYSIGKLDKNNLSTVIVDDAFKKAREQIDVFLHTHDASVAQMSLPFSQKDEDGNLKKVNGDLITSLTTGLRDGIKYQIIKAGNEIQLFNAELLHDDYSKAFSDDNIEETKDKFVKQVDELKQDFEKRFYTQYLHNFIEDYNHNFNNSDLLSALVKFSGIDSESVSNNISKNGLDNKFVEKFIEECKDESYESVEEILIATLNQFKGQLSGMGELFDAPMISSITSYIKKLAGENKIQSFVLGSMDLTKNDVWQHTLRSNSERIFRNALDDKSFDISKYIQNWKDYRDFINENPLKFPDEKKDIFGISNAQEYLKLIKEIENELNTISDKKINVFVTNNDQENITPIQSDVSNIEDKFKDENNTVQKVVTEESKSLDLLKLKIDDVCKAIQEKIDKFEEEKDSVSAVVSSERADLDLLRDKLAEIKGYIEQLYDYIGNLGSIDFNGKVKIEGLSTLLSSLKDDKLDTKLTAMYTYLDDFAKAVNQIDFKSNLTEQLNSILSKGEELKNLASILKKSNKGKIKEAGKAVTAKDSEDLKAYNDSYKTLISTEERYQELTNKQNAGLILSAKEAKELVKIEGDRTHAQEKINEIIKKTSGEIKKQSDAEQEFSEHQKITAKAIEAAADAQAKLDAANNRKSLEKDLQKEIDKLNDLKIAPKFTDSFGEKIKDELEEARKGFQKTDDEVEELINHLKDFRNSIPKNALESSYTALDAYALDISKTLTNNSKMSRKLKNELNALYDTVIRYRKTGLFDDKDLLNIKNRIIEIKDEILRTEQNGRSMIDKIGMQIKHISSQQIARYFSFYDIIRYIRQISAEVIKLDTALTELRKVSDASNERLQQSLVKSTETAKELGSTIDDVIKVTSDWARLGYNVDEAEELARVTTLFKNVGDNMSAEDASSYLISTLQGFQLAADQSEEIIDRYNAVANNFAIDTAGIGEALQRSAASFNAANTDLSQSIALITATNEVIQNPESVGKYKCLHIQ